MTVTLTILAAWLVLLAAVVLFLDWQGRRRARRDRELVRRITRYLDSLPPARPW